MPAGTHPAVTVKTILCLFYSLPVIFLNFSVPAKIIPAGFHRTLIFIHIDPGFFCHAAIFPGIVSSIDPGILCQIAFPIQIIGHSLGSFPLILYIRTIAVHKMNCSIFIDPAFFRCHNRKRNCPGDQSSNNQCPDPVCHPTFLIFHILSLLKMAAYSCFCKFFQYHFIRKIRQIHELILNIYITIP